jgi:hypothetical protein
MAELIDRDEYDHQVSIDPARVLGGALISLLV